jgi:hypothetical protein
MTRRPSQRECYLKAQAALDAVKAGKRAIALSKHLPEAMELFDACDPGGFWEKIECLLEELCELDVAKCYAGSQPPQRSYEEKMKGLELWPFKWRSRMLLGREVYLKFCIKGNSFLFVDCHENRKEK